MYFPGKKTKAIFDELIKENLPSNMEDFIYVEPFGGSFAVRNFLETDPKYVVYNDIHLYDGIEINANIELHLDYKDVIEKYDSISTIFYLDPPYFRKEYVYGISHDIDFHTELFDVLSNIKGKFILSYENNTFISKLYNKFEIKHYNGKRNKLTNEIIIIN